MRGPKMRLGPLNKVRIGQIGRRRLLEVRCNSTVFWVSQRQHRHRLVTPRSPASARLEDDPETGNCFLP
jgi:hypothetical protein